MNKLEAIGKKGTFICYREKSKPYIIYVLGQRNIEFRRDVTFDEDISLGKARETPSLAIFDKKDDAMDILEGPSMLGPQCDIFYDLMEPIDPLDPPLCDPPTRKNPLWIHDTL